MDTNESGDGNENFSSEGVQETERVMFDNKQVHKNVNHHLNEDEMAEGGAVGSVLSEDIDKLSSIESRSK